MIYLLDTHFVIWSLIAPERISVKIRQLIENPAIDIRISDASIWEIGIKLNKKRLDFGGASIENVVQTLLAQRFTLLPIARQHILEAVQVPFNHQDSFDRLLIAQAKLEKCVLVTLDEQIKQYAIATI